MAVAVAACRLSFGAVCLATWVVAGEAQAAGVEVDLVAEVLAAVVVVLVAALVVAAVLVVAAEEEVGRAASMLSASIGSHKQRIW